MITSATTQVGINIQIWNFLQKKEKRWVDPSNTMKENNTRLILDTGKC